MYLHTKFQVCRSSGYKTCRANGRQRRTTRDGIGSHVSQQVEMEINSHPASCIPSSGWCCCFYYGVYSALTKILKLTGKFSVLPGEQSVSYHRLHLGCSFTASTGWRGHKNQSDTGAALPLAIVAKTKVLLIWLNLQENWLHFLNRVSVRTC